MKTLTTVTGLLFVALLSLNATTTYGQDDVEKNKLKIEVEPALLFNGGRSLMGLYSITKNNNLALGLYLMSTNIPDQVAHNMFDNLTDSTTARVSAEAALNVRYRLKLDKKHESNPYIGLIAGWENIRLQKAGLKDLNVSTVILTPHIGYEIYFYKKMFYFNPQIRSVFYLGTSNSDATRSEKLKSYTFIPSLSVGIRL